ncbi:hypothetical protein [Reinekea marinisedimentorum]|uniref:Uncharacterized protein n=1 Tax=Reinekea marinisedimentorum TaxID=230495 RepID=A0A4R3HZF8_9GAMM|nr:hypothetical protein [Reinekea marinisedimentorum]TCS38766.1 hypothetical protein BCF53_11540 [Reinekea marinisedimentorum]
MIKEMIGGIAIGTLVFMAGYFFGQHQQQSPVDAAVKPSLFTTTTAQPAAELCNTEANITPVQSSAATIPLEPEQTVSRDQQTPAQTTATTNLNDDIITLLNRYLAEASNRGDDYEVLERHRDELQSLLMYSELNQQRLADYMLDFSSHSIEFNYALSLIKSLPEQQKQAWIGELIYYVSGQTDAFHQSQFLALVSAQPDQRNDPNTFNALVDIAAYQAVTAEHKNRAVDFLDPFRLDPATKSQIVASLQDSLNSRDTDDNDRDQLFSNLLKFSGANQKLELAQNYLNANEALSIRQRIISAINAGTINRSAELKLSLLEVALDDSDSLQEAAKESLFSHFDLSNDEYELLNS